MKGLPNLAFGNLDITGYEKVGMLLILLSPVNVHYCH